MLVTFRCKAYADITLFGDVAVQLLKMMGHSGSVPGALMPEDIPPALERLEQALQQQSPPVRQPASDDEEPEVSMQHRALPLIELLQSAARASVPVMWDK